MQGGLRWLSPLWLGFLRATSTAALAAEPAIATAPAIPTAAAFAVTAPAITPTPATPVPPTAFSPTPTAAIAVAIAAIPSTSPNVQRDVSGVVHWLLLRVHQPCNGVCWLRLAGGLLPGSRVLQVGVTAAAGAALSTTHDTPVAAAIASTP